jgi:MATE family multidrug resistance protein
MGLREYGAAAATNITYLLNMIIADLWIKASSKDTFEHMVFMPGRHVFKDIGLYLKIGIPGMLMLCFEWWAFELLALFTGILGVYQLAAEVCIINMISFIFMMPLGISYSASALTGNYIGEGKIDLAKKFAAMTLVFDMILTSFIVLILGTGKVAIS